MVLSRFGCSEPPSMLQSAVLYEVRVLRTSARALQSGTIHWTGRIDKKHSGAGVQ